MFRFRAPPIIDVVAGSPSRSPPVVLIVEDDPLLRMLAVEVVEEAGFVALEAGNADEAVALLEIARIFRCCSPTSTYPEAWTG